MLAVDVTGRVTWSGGMVWAPARILVDHLGRAAVWDGRRGIEAPVWSGRLTADGGTLTAADGTTIEAMKEGCGCGNRLSALGEMDLAKLAVPA